MITIMLTGGTGNQLFGYALGEAQKALGQKVVYNTKNFHEQVMRKYMLGRLGLVLPTTHDKDGVQIHEHSMLYDPSILYVQNDATLHGYFQNEKYFSHCKDTVRNNLSIAIARKFAETYSMSSVELIQRIKAGPSCFIHVRRSDYIKNVWLHGELGIDYYQEAIDRIMLASSSIVHFYVFSDDPAWCRQHFTWDNMTVIDSKMSATVDAGNNITYADGGQEALDLYLMTNCDYAIIANSTFSWWGAYLGKKRMVIAPKDWFNPGTIDGSDIVPQGWLKI